MLRAERICTDFILKHQFILSAGGRFTKSANRKHGWPMGRWCDKVEQAIVIPIAIGSGALWGKQRVTEKTITQSAFYLYKAPINLTFPPFSYI
jgi:hypothetical protein